MVQIADITDAISALFDSLVDDPSLQEYFLNRLKRDSGRYSCFGTNTVPIVFTGGYIAT